MPASAKPAIQSERSLVILRASQDSDLVAACLSGDAAAERTLYDAHVASMYRVAFRMCGDSDVAEDITQEAFVRAFRRLRQFRGDSSLRTWLTAITISSGASLLRKGSWLRNKAVQLTDNIVARQQREDAPPDLAAHLDTAIAKLSPKLHVVFVMYDVEGHTHPEISAALGIPIGTSKARLHSARARLRATLSREYGKLQT